MFYPYYQRFYFDVAQKPASIAVDRISNTIAHLRSFVHRDDSLLVSCVNAAVIGSLELVGEQIAAHGITVQKHLGKIFLND